MAKKTTEIDLHIGRRLRRRRHLLGLTQQTLAESIGIRFQQIQKYECGANRVTASRLYELAGALKVPVNYFYEGLQNLQQEVNGSENTVDPMRDPLADKNVAALVQSYYRLEERSRRRLLDLAKALADPEDN